MKTNYLMLDYNEYPNEGDMLIRLCKKFIYCLSNNDKNISIINYTTRTNSYESNYCLRYYTDNYVYYLYVTGYINRECKYIYDIGLLVKNRKNYRTVSRLILNDTCKIQAYTNSMDNVISDNNLSADDIEDILNTYINDMDMNINKALVYLLLTLDKEINTYVLRKRRDNNIVFCNPYSVDKGGYFNKFYKDLKLDSV